MKRKFGEHIAEGMDTLVEISQRLSEIEKTLEANQKALDELESANDVLKLAVETHGLLNDLRRKNLAGIRIFLATFSPCSQFAGKCRVLRIS